MYTLVVVDMQEMFGVTSDCPVTLGCKREIEQAREDDADIIYLEFRDKGPTLPTLIELTKKHSKTYVMEKQTNDGSPEVLSLAQAKGVFVERFRVVGVNTEYCVLSTVSGLTQKFPEATVEVVPDACGSYWGSEYKEKGHLFGLERLRTLRNVVLLEERPYEDR